MSRRRVLGWTMAGALALAACLPGQTHGRERQAMLVRVTHYYSTGSPMASGEMPYVGAAACGAAIGFGATVVTPDGAAWSCRDTGELAANQVDFFGFCAECVYGSYTMAEVQ